MSRGEGNTSTGVAAPVATRTIDQLLELFDALPAPYRRFVREAPYNIDTDLVATIPLNVLRFSMREIVKDSALLAYGPDHPEARKR